MRLGQMLDLKFALGSTIKVQAEKNGALVVDNSAVTRFR
jgi:hypothetical protein